MPTAKRIEDWLKAAAGAAAGAVTCGAALKFAWTPVSRLVGSHSSQTVGDAVAFSICVLLGIAALWLTRGVLTADSRLIRAENFDLRVRSEADLLHRERDTEHLRALALHAGILLIDGESGSGKSALVRFGLAPALNREIDRLPVLVSEYHGDWDAGLAETVYRAIWIALDAKARQLSGVSRRSPTEPVDGPALSALLGAVIEETKLKPVLIFDQFDDYQFKNRTAFLDENDAWISADGLIAKNRAWATLAALNARRLVDLVFVTRSDAAAGFNAIRFSQAVSQKTVLPLPSTSTAELIAKISTGEAGREVVLNPDAGWTELSRRLELDLRRADFVLPQQVRIAFLGLQQLPSLTVHQYNKAGGVPGLEALYLRAAINRAAQASTLASSALLAVLLRLVDRQSGATPKTRTATFDELTSPGVDAGLLQRALAHLKDDEIIREVSDLGQTTWKLDHDYLVRPILTAERISNRSYALLREHAERFELSANPFAFYQKALPLGAQLKLLVDRLKPRSAFRYGRYRTFAILSLVRALPVTLLAVASVFVFNQARIDTQARAIIDGLDANQDITPSLTLWTAPTAVRERVANHMLKTPERLRSAGSRWALAYASVDQARARSLAQRLILASNADAEKLPVGAVAPMLQLLLSRMSGPQVVDTIVEFAAADDRARRTDKTLAYLYGPPNDFMPVYAADLRPAEQKSLLARLAAAEKAGGRGSGELRAMVSDYAVGLSTPSSRSKIVSQVLALNESRAFDARTDIILAISGRIPTLVGEEEKIEYIDRLFSYRRLNPKYIGLLSSEYFLRILLMALDEAPRREAVKHLVQRMRSHEVDGVAVNATILVDLLWDASADDAKYIRALLRSRRLGPNEEYGRLQMLATGCRAPSELTADDLEFLKGWLRKYPPGFLNYDLRVDAWRCLGKSAIETIRTIADAEKGSPSQAIGAVAIRYSLSPQEAEDVYRFAVGKIADPGAKNLERLAIINSLQGVLRSFPVDKGWEKLRELDTLTGHIKTVDKEQVMLHAALGVAVGAYEADNNDKRALKIFNLSVANPSNDQDFQRSIMMVDSATHCCVRSIERGKVFEAPLGQAFNFGRPASDTGVGQKRRWID